MTLAAAPALTGSEGGRNEKEIRREPLSAQGGPNHLRCHCAIEFLFPIADG